MNTAYDFDPDAGYRGSMFWCLWPNTTFNILPGSNELAVYRIRPIDYEWSSFEGDVLTADGRTNEARTTYTAKVLAPEDIALCESVQRGLKSKGYDQGPIMAGDVPSGENEYAIHHFHKLVYEALISLRRIVALMAAPPRGPGALHSVPGSLARARHCGAARSGHLAALVLDPVERACGLQRMLCMLFVD